jgi:hypothetical protein
LYRCSRTAAYRKLAGKELAEDATFELERRRNRPEKYDREVVGRTITAMQRIDDIRTRRQERFYEKRMKVGGGGRDWGSVGCLHGRSAGGRAGRALSF